MSNTATKIVLVVVLALPAASFARAGGTAEFERKGCNDRGRPDARPERNDER